MPRSTRESDDDAEHKTVEESNSEENLPSSDSTTEMSTQDSFSNLSNSKKEEKLEINKNLSGIEISLKQSLTKELMIKVENLNTSVEEQKESPSNKENQTLNIINDTLESNIHSSTNVISLSTKSPTPIFANKSSNEKETKFTKNESNLNKRRHSKESTEATMKQCILSKEIIDDIEEKMNISIDSSSSDLTCKQKCLDNLSVNDTIKRQSLVHEAECKSILSREEDVGSANEIIVKDKTPVKHISKSTDNIMEEITKSDKTEHTIMDTDSDVNKDSNNIELNKISCLSKNQNKTKEESDNKKSLSSVSIIGDNKMKLMLEEQSLYQNKNEASSNISHFNSDLTDLIVMSSVKNSNDQSNIMEKQPIQDNIIDNIDFTEQERRNSKHAIESVLESSNAALKTSNSEFNESNEDNAIIQDTQPSNVTETSGKFAINMPCEKAETKSNYKNTVKQESKRKSTDNIHLEKKKENLKLENQNDTNMNTDRDVIVDINVFHDITNDNSNKKNVEEELDIETNSVYSNLLKEPESESEVECDLVLVDKKAWLDAENMKTAKEAESFEYDSDDTVLLKSRLDAKTTDHEQIIAKKLPMISEDLLENRVDAKVGNCNKKSLIEEEKIDCNNKIINSISRMKKMIKNYKDSLSSTEDEDDLIAAVNKSINEFKTVSNQNNDRPVPKLNKSRQTFAKDGDRLFQIYDESDESIQSDDINELNKSLQVNKKNKSLSKSMERRKSLNKSSTKDMSSRQEAKATKNISINKSREDYSEKESDSTDAKKKTSKKKHSLNKSQNKDANTSESEEKNLSNAKTSTYLNDESDNDDNSEIVIPAMDFECRSYSTIAYMGSDPNEESNDDESKNSIGIPSFLFAANSDSNTDSSTDVNTSIHSDIKREYNLDGKEQKFSDDNVPGDECRASESEVSDPDDNGSDLEDFIVNDDEIEEEDNEDEIEEEDNEDDDDDEEKERNSEEENEQNVEEAEYAKEEEVDNESEIKQSIREENKVMKKKEVKDKSYTPNSSIKKKKKSNVQFSPKDVVEQLNKSEITSTRKLSKSRLSMECSTPKLDTYIRKYEEFNETLTPERILEIQDTKIDNTKTAQDTSLKKKKSKKNSILKEDISLREFNQIDNEKKLLNSSLPSDLAEAVKKAGLSKPKFSKMGELQKTINITHTESPTIRYLIKDKLNESMPALKLNTEIDSEKKKLSPIKKAKDIAQTKIELENDEKEIPNLITPSSDDTIQKRRKKQKKRKAQTEDISSENITDKVLSQDMMESDAPKKKKRVKLAHLSIIENDTCKDNQINEKETKQKKKQLSVIEQDKNVNEENVPQKNIRKNKTELAQRKKRNYEIVDSSEFDLSADIAVENKSKRQKIAESKEIVSEKLIKKKKREEKTSPLQIGISKLKSGKSLASNKLQNVGSDTINSKNAFAKARDEALEAIHAAEMRVRAKKELKKKKRENVENTIQEQILKIPDRKQRKKGVEKNDFLPSSTGRLKRLPDDVVENLTDLPTKAKKRQKLSRNQEQIMPLSHGSKSKATIAKADGFLTLSTSGSTTQFTVINMRKAKKESLKSGSAAVSFRQRMLDRNSRESVSAYKIYLEKQRATSKSRFFNNAF
ncbi:reticulocyte-binding protein homolog 2a-like [Cataglyphis hispanica]|uniref:reticulocyte-binding protein homolog 2a-like n=1 Tax=Cataglyphis hispanica TaxID=1086592 RepID=UPI00217F5068|nr:reticulocyte-binding protein homolog 2a-like [Cataglyphis hispanica]